VLAVKFSGCPEHIGLLFPAIGEFGLALISNRLEVDDVA
jgi:hypothetical protein